MTRFVVKNEHQKDAYYCEDEIGYVHLIMLGSIGTTIERAYSCDHFTRKRGHFDLLTLLH